MLPAASEPSTSKGAPYLQLVSQVQARQRREDFFTSALYGAIALSALLVTAGFLPASWAGVGKLLLLSALPTGAAAAALVVLLGKRRHGSPILRSVEAIAEVAPSLRHDLLSAVELDRELDKDPPFSIPLTRAFLDQVGAKSTSVEPSRVVSIRPRRNASIALAGALVCCLVAIALWPKRWWEGISRAARGEQVQVSKAPAEPVTGDIEVTYRFPPYTGLSPKTVQAPGGEIRAIPGTEVAIATRADREVTGAELVIGGRRVGLKVADRRALTGSFVLDKTATYSFVLYRGEREIARGPPMSIQVDPDAAPTVTLQSPAEEIEVGPQAPITLLYQASDDFGISELALVYRVRGGTEARVKLPAGAKRLQDHYVWELPGLGLSAGDRVDYFIEATDNDDFGGRKKAVSRTQTVKIYSAAEHRQQAVRQAEELWHRGLSHLADRLEGPELALVAAPDDAARRDRVAQAQAVDAAGVVLSQDYTALGRALQAAKDAPEEIAAALINIGQGLLPKVRTTIAARRAYLQRGPGYPSDAGARRLSKAAQAEIEEVEKDLLFLESILDRERVFALQELAKSIGEEKRGLAALIQRLVETSDPKLQARILDEVNRMKGRLNQLLGQMAELAKGIRDEHLNPEALKQALGEQDFKGALDEVERQVKEGNAKEALKELASLGMQLDALERQLDGADQSVGDERFGPLAEEFARFVHDLKGLTDDERALSQKTKSIRDRQRNHLRETLEKRAAATKEGLLKQIDQALRDYRALEPGELGPDAAQPLEQAQAELENSKAAIQGGDFDLAIESASRAQDAAARLSMSAKQQERLEALFQRGEQARQRAAQQADRLSADAAKVREVNRRLGQLLPRDGTGMTGADAASMAELEKEQRRLEQAAQKLQTQLDGLEQTAPIFGEEGARRLEEAGQRMSHAQKRLAEQDPGRGYVEEQAALEQLDQLGQQMQRSAGKGNGRSFPMPMLASPSQPGWGDTSHEKVAIPDEDPARPQELRKDLLDAMKQAPPERYKDQVKRYYEELIK